VSLFALSILGVARMDLAQRIAESRGALNMYLALKISLQIGVLGTLMQQVETTAWEMCEFPADQ